MSNDNKNNNKKPELVKKSGSETIQNTNKKTATISENININKSGDRQRPLSMNPANIDPIKKK